MLTPAASHEALVRDFRWDLPMRLNMARQVLDTWAEGAPDRVAVLDLSHERDEVSYGRLREMADGLAAEFAARGIAPGDRLGVLRSQDAWTLAAHLAAWKLGAISIPLFKLFGRDALVTRLSDAEAKLVVADRDPPEALRAWQGAVLIPEDARLGTAPVEAADTGPEDPAIIIFTSGTTGSPKGALHGHRVLTGHLPGVEISHDFLGQAGDVIWTPADWAWIGGLFDVAMPGLALGVPVVAARRSKFTPEDTVNIIREGTVRNVFFPPTALRMLKAAEVAIPGLRSVASGGEPLGAEMLDWGRRAFGLAINEFYGQTECNMVASSCGALFPARPGCIGKPVPGHEVQVIDESGAPASGEGDVAIRRGSASMMLRYWNRPDATAGKFRGDWMLTGDRGIWDEGYLRFIGREDDVITSAGYRIGPSEIEDCLITHPAVAAAGVVGRPDALRTEVVVAFVVLRDGVAGDESLARELQEYAKERVARHSYPREITFVPSLPMTVTGKVLRRELRARAMEEEA